MCVHDYLGGRAGFHPEISVWGGRGIVASCTRCHTPPPPFPLNFVCLSVTEVLYSAKFSRENTFMNFAVLEPSVKVSPQKLGVSLPTYDRL